MAKMAEGSRASLLLLYVEKNVDNRDAQRMVIRFELSPLVYQVL